MIEKLILLAAISILPLGAMSQSRQHGTPFKSKYLNQIETSDVLYIDGEKYYISRSPLVVFYGFKYIFAGLEARHRAIVDYVESFPGSSKQSKISKLEGKNYSVSWKIFDGKLYLNDLSFPVINGKKERDKLFPNNEQYKAIEELVGKKFERSDTVAREAFPVGTYGVIPATWVNGDYLIKKFPSTPSIKEEDWDVEYDVYKITIRKGKVVAKTKVEL